MKKWEDGIVAVTGCGRSGTSMVMQTLNILGIPMSAPPFIAENEHVKEFNPKGFYELNLMGGIYDDTYKGKAVKLFGEQLYRTSKHLLSRLIYITRYRQDAIDSYDRMRSLMPACEYTTEAIYDANEWKIRAYVANDPNVMCVSYEQVCQDQEKFVNDLSLYLQITPTEQQREEAIKNIKK